MTVEDLLIKLQELRVTVEGALDFEVLPWGEIEVDEEKKTVTLL